MNENLPQQELLMKYVDETLNPEEQLEFEKELNQNEELRREVENLQSVRDAVKLYALREKVASVRSNMTPVAVKKTAVVNKIYFYKSVLRIAAAIIIFLGLGALYKYYTISNANVYKEMYEPYNISSMRGDANFNSIEESYKAKKYEETISIFEKENNPSIKDLFFAGNAYLNLSNYSKAQEIFGEIISKNKNSGSFQFQDDVEYYLALTYLANNEKEKALPLFQKIHDDIHHAYHDHVSSWMLLKLKWSHK